MFQRILVALDQAETENYVFDHAIALAKAVNARLMLLHVVVPFDQGHPSAGIYPDRTLDTVQVNVDLWQRLEAHGLQHLQALTTEATQANIATEFTQALGDPGQIICQVAKQWQADLILIGRRTSSAWSEFWLGSVSNYVVHYAPCSVLTVQGRSSDHGRLLHSGQARNLREVVGNRN
jgi:nucleotide-binding universal stress UspA family protein